MAEIRVQPKPRSRAWLWALLTLAVVAVAAWSLLHAGLVTVRQTGLEPAAAPGAPSLAAAAPVAVLVARA